jgi:hypothetical protein
MTCMASNEAGYLDLKSLALYSSCSVRWLRDRLVDRIQPLPHHRVEGKILVKREDFDKWIASHRIIGRGPGANLSNLVDSIVSEVQVPRRLP